MNNRNVKIIGTIVGIVLFIALIAGISYAWITWQSDNTKISGNSKCFPNIDYTNGTSLSTDNVLLFDESKIINNNKITLKDGMAYLGVTAGVQSGCDTPVSFIIEMDVTSLSDAYISGDSIGAFKYVLASYDPSVTDLNELNGQSLDIIEKNSITSTGLSQVNDTVLTTDTQVYLLIFYIDGDMAFNDAQYSEFNVSITGKAMQVGE